VNSLIARIEAAANELTDRVLGEMYKNAFWHARYGEGADKHGRQDGLFHIKYLGEALTSNDAGVMEQYARWLQALLTTRGMCSLHVDENFALLAAAIRETITDSEPAGRMLDRARKALLYPPSPARTLQDYMPRLPVELHYHASYAADALHLSQPKIFTDYVAFVGGDADAVTLRRIVTSELPSVTLPA
jgi:hypothetical protein